MTEYERQLEIAKKENVIIIEQYDMNSTGLKGLYCNGTIALSKDIKTNAERSCILAEELGHHYTTVGDILNQNNENNCKQELKARLWAYNKKIGLIGIVKAYKKRCQNLAEMAEYLNVSEPFLKEALERYRMKYGCKVEIDNYIILFEPQLAVIEKI